MIIIENTTGGALGLTWPACALSGDALPTTIAAGQILAIPFEMLGTALGTTALYYRAPAGTVHESPPDDRAEIPWPISSRGDRRHDHDFGRLRFLSGRDRRCPRTISRTATHFQTAFNQACAINGVLLLPPGVIQLPTGGLVLLSTFIGGVGIRGAGKNVSILVQSNASSPDALSKLHPEPSRRRMPARGTRSSISAASRSPAPPRD